MLVVISLKGNSGTIIRMVKVCDWYIIGVYYFADGARYEGTWSNGKKHGKGKSIENGRNIHNSRWKAIDD